MRKKVVSPAHRRRAALEVMENKLCSGRAACRFLRLSRSTLRYRPREATPLEAKLGKRMEELSHLHPRYGYRRIAALLRREGWRAGKRLVQRIRRACGLRVPPARRKRIRRGHSTGLPTRAERRGHVWTWDFIADATQRGGALRILTILDEHTRECHVLHADRALTSEDVLEWLGNAVAEHGAPEYLRSDNGPEFIARKVQAWLAEKKIRTLYIDPGSPWQNGYVESFHGRFRDECLNREHFFTMTEARIVIGDYREEYNRVRPHGGLGYLSPDEFVSRQAQDRQASPETLNPESSRPD